MPDLPPLGRRLFAEFLGTGLLVAVVIGSGIAAQRLSPDDIGLQLLQNSLTTVFGLGESITTEANFTGSANDEISPTPGFSAGNCCL